jgi:polyphenol oxidase
MMTPAASPPFQRPAPGLVESPALAALKGIRHAFFTREGGVSNGIYASLNGGMGSSDDKALVQENRERMARHLGVAPTHLVSVWQVHSPDALVVTGPWGTPENPKADAMVSVTPGVALAVAGADCGPLLFADAEAGVVGAAHAGWKGALTGVAESTIAAMVTLGATRSRITVALGPMISQKAYEVGPEFVAQFLAVDPVYQRFFVASTRKTHSMFDLHGFNVAQLERSGVGTIENLGLCTYSDEERFFSYRRTTHRAEPDYGRLISAIALTG